MRLLTMSCPKNLEGEFVARELAERQTLKNLYAFGDKLRENYRLMRAGKATT